MSLRSLLFPGFCLLIGLPLFGSELPRGVFRAESDISTKLAIDQDDRLTFERAWSPDGKLWLAYEFAEPLKYHAAKKAFVAVGRVSFSVRETWEGRPRIFYGSRVVRLPEARMETCHFPVSLEIRTSAVSNLLEVVVDAPGKFELFPCQLLDRKTKTYRFSKETLQGFPDEISGKFRGRILNTSPNSSLPPRLELVLSTGKAANGQELRVVVKLYSGDFGTYEYLEIPSLPKHYDGAKKRLTIETDFGLILIADLSAATETGSITGAILSKDLESEIGKFSLSK